VLGAFPPVDSLRSVQAVDLLGNGTACLVWTSSSQADARRSMRYINLMGGQKPHLLLHTRNNMGAETRLFYAPSTKFYLADRAAGTPWVTRLPFPYDRVDLFGATRIPRCTSLPRQQASPLQISGKESACASWQNSIATSCVLQLNPLAARSALCFFTRAANSRLGKCCSS
jgi:Insecticide toxin TcdB middle/N-terminal region